MADLILFHHAQGLTDGVHAFADRFRAAGHRVTVPDLLEGKTFGSVEEGVAHAEEIGFGTVIARGAAAAADLPANVVYAGMSLGVLPAQRLAATRPGSPAALFFHSCVPGALPDDLLLQIHVSERDSWGDVDDARALVDAKPNAELFLYDGDAHLFTDSSFAVYDAKSTDLVVERSLALLSRLS